MRYLAAAMLLLFGGVGLGIALARWKRRAVVTIGVLMLLGVSVVLLIPTARHVIQCRIGGRFWAKDAHPPELVGAWVGWDTSFPTPYCRLELEADGTGSCAFWYDREQTAVWRVTRWNVSGNRIDLSIESGERREQMRGAVSVGPPQGPVPDRHLSLEYFGSDGPDLIKNWFGPLHLVPEGTDAEARQAVQRALERR